MQGSQLLRADGRGSGEPLLQGGEDLDPFDGVDPEIRIETHFKLQHLHRIAGFLTDDG